MSKELTIEEKAKLYDEIMEKRRLAAKKGNQSRTAEQRKASAKKAIEARWAKKKK